MPRNTKSMDPLLKLAIGALEDMKAQNITVLDVMKLTTVTDTMVICTGTSNRHVKSLAQNVAEDAKHAGYQPLGIEGSEQGEWVLVDLGGVVVHVMQAQARAFYQLEKLWAVAEEADAPAVRKTAKKPQRSTTTKAKRAAAKAAGVKKRLVNAGVKKRAPVKAAASAPKTAAAKKAVPKKPATKKAAPRKAVRK